MNCGYGEKLILYFYGEADARLKADVEGHLAACSVCRGELAALSSAGAYLSAAVSLPPEFAVDAVMRAARAAAGGGRRGFIFSFREFLTAGALAAVMAGLFAFSGQPAGGDLKWTSSLDTDLDSAEYSMSQTQLEFNSASADLDYRFGALEDEGLGVDDEA
jgi:anti-sigma factor RsiW